MLHPSAACVLVNNHIINAQIARLTFLGLCNREVSFFQVKPVVMYLFQMISYWLSDEVMANSNIVIF